MSLLKLQDKAFTIITYVNYIVYALVLLGLSYLTPESVSTLNKYMPVYVSIFLLFRFNPIKRKDETFTELDRKIAFSSGVFLFLTTTVGTLTQKFLEKYVINPVKEKTKSEIIKAQNTMS